MDAQAKIHPDFTYASTFPTSRAVPHHPRRSMQRMRRQSLLSAALLLILGQGSALAATITVSDTCTLVDAVVAADTNTATGGCPAGDDQTDTIVLPAASAHILTDADANFGLGLQVTSEMTITGNNARISRSLDAEEVFRIFTVELAGNLTLDAVTVIGGNQTFGGGIRNSGTLVLTNSTIELNTASQGAGIHNDGTLTVSNSTIQSNDASTGTDGGGVYNGGTATLTNNTISLNKAGTTGGGVANAAGGTATLIHNTITRNTGGIGGGVLNQGTLTLRGNLIAGNISPDGREVNNTVGVGTVGANTLNLFGFNGLPGAVGFKRGPTNIVPVKGVTVAKILCPLALVALDDLTRTHALIAGSPALNKITTGCPPPLTDQRGTPRPQPTAGPQPPAACDIGSFEAEGGVAPLTCPPDLSK